MAVQNAVLETNPTFEDQVAGQTNRFTRYWVVSRSLMLFWLLLSLWQIGAYPLTEGDDEALSVLMGFRLASAFEDPIAFLSPFVQGRPPISYLPTVLGAHLLPVNEFTMRLPYALIGALQMPLLLALVSRTFSRRAAAFAGLLLLGTGLFAINRLTLGISVFMTLELAGALLLLRYLASGDRRWLVLSSISLAAAALTFFDGAILLAAALGIAWWRYRSRCDIGFAALTGFGIAGVYGIASLVTTWIYSNRTESIDGASRQGAFGHITDRLGGISFPDIGFFDTWIVYIGVPVLLLTLIGIAEALIHSRPHRHAVMALLVLAGASAVPWLFLEPRHEHPVFAVPLLLAVAGFGWAQLLRQLESVATQVVVTMAIAAIAMGGVVWQQAVFNPETEFTTRLSGVGEYAAALEHGHGLFESDDSGIKAVAHVLREETDVDDRVYVRDGVAAGAIRLYAGRNALPLKLGLASDGSGLDGAFLVIKGEDDAFNGGLSGATNVVANHRIYADGEVLYQIVEFSDSGDSFDAPIWWRAEVHGEKLFREQSHFTDYLRPIDRSRIDSQF